MEFYELIHTRCKLGVDIEHGRTISSEGYKEFAYSHKLPKHRVDLQYIVRQARVAQSFSDPDYMPDAYIYHAPESKHGLMGFMLNFHPIPWDKCYDEHNFSNRPGNFINQMFIGDFAKTQFYPFELFGDDTVWDAKSKLGPAYVCGGSAICIKGLEKNKSCVYPSTKKLQNYGYYYNTAPIDIPPRALSPVKKKYTFTSLGNFIAYGRRDALQKAVAFIIKQFESLNECKFLVVQDESAENIEMWIAAIQCAFSPHMASAISFATRLEKYETTNRCTVNQDGKVQIGLSNVNLQERYHAMIVGVDEQDKSVSMSRGIPNASYVLLDGVTKTTHCSVDTTPEYFDAISLFDAVHETFCRDVVQVFAGLNMPGSCIIKLYDAYTLLLNLPSKKVAVKDVCNALSLLSELKPQNMQPLQKLCQSVVAYLPYALIHSPIKAFEIARWLVRSTKNSCIAYNENDITEILLQTFEDVLFEEIDITAAANIWEESVRNSENAQSFAAVIVSYEWIQHSKHKLVKLLPEDCCKLLAMYIDAYSIVENLNSKGLDILTEVVFSSLCAYSATHHAGSVFNLFEKRPTDPEAYVLSIACDMQNAGNLKLAEYMVECLVEVYGIAYSNEYMVSFNSNLIDYRLDEYIPLVLKSRFDALDHAIKKEYIPFIKVINEYRDIVDISEIYEDIDLALAKPLLDMQWFNIANELLNTTTSQNCVNAAHVFALGVTNKDTSPMQLIKYYNWLEQFNFPFVCENGYVTKLAEQLGAVQFEKQFNVHIQLLDILAMNPSLFKEYATLICQKAIKQFTARWNDLMSFTINNCSHTEHIMVAMLGDIQSDKTLNTLRKTLSDENHKRYFDYLIENALTMQEQKNSRKKSSLFTWIKGKK